MKDHDFVKLLGSLHCHCAVPSEHQDVWFHVTYHSLITERYWNCTILTNPILYSQILKETSDM